MQNQKPEPAPAIAQTHISETDKRKKWDRLRAEWGARLLQQFPSGLPPEPDFRKDHLACSRWVTEALSVYTLQAMVWELPPLHLADGRNYPNFMDLSLDEQCEIAESTFADAVGVWQLAKTAGDARSAKETFEVQARAAQQEREIQEHREDDQRVEEFIRRTMRVESIEELESMWEPLDDEIRKSLQRHNYRAANVARRQLLAVQTQAIAVQTQAMAVQARAIALEKKRSVRNRRFASAAFMVAIAGIAFGVIAVQFPTVLEAARKEASWAVHAAASAVNKTSSAASSANPESRRPEGAGR